LELVRKLVLNNLDKQIVIDADAISAFDTNDVLSKNVVLTPHFGEFSNLINKNTNSNNDGNIFDGKTDIGILIEIANKMNCNILLKGSTTLITDGVVTYWNNFGNAGMATAGSGDVLSGVIGAILARNNNSHIRQADFNFITEVAISSLIHSLAGDYYAENYDMETLTASEMIKCIKFVLKKKYNNNWL
jgi:NAD(P)H-hydrate epimerase